MKPIRRRITAAALVVLCAVPAVVIAAEQIHTVRAGDSVSTIAKQYYGDPAMAELMMRYNGRTGTTIRAGEKLKIGICEVHKVGAGDTWSRLSSKYLNRTSAFPVVAALNGFTPDHVLQPGETIVMPVVLAHKLVRGDSLDSLAGRFYGNTALAGLLQTFNELEDPRRLTIGQTLQVPLITLVGRKNRIDGITARVSVPAAAVKAGAVEPPKTAAAKPSVQEPRPSPAKAAAVKAPAQEPKATKSSEPVTKPAQTTQGAPKATAGAVQKTPEPPAQKIAKPDPQPALPPVTLPHATASPAASEPPGAAAQKPASPSPGAPVPAAASPEAPSHATVKPLGLDKEIAEASKAFAEGNYARARQLLESMRERTRGGGTDAEKAAVGRLLAFVYVAFDMKKEACSTFRSISGLEAKPGMDPDLVSPKIREALSGCTAGST